MILHSEMLRLLLQGERLSLALPYRLISRLGCSMLLLGTSRAYFRVNQPLVVEANLPTFLTIGDQITLPLKLIVSPAKLAP